jgi:hypothetical protein
MSARLIGITARQTNRERRFGPDAACVRCGIAALETLVPIKRSILESHHICARENDPGLTVPVCRNCHAVLTEGQQAAGVTFTTPPTLLHQIAAALASLFAMLHDLCERGMDWAHQLTILAADLDAAYPEWRDLDSARAIGVTL